MESVYMHVKPMGLSLSCAFFGIPALGFIAVFYGLWPWMVSLGWSPMFSLLLSLSCLLVSILCAAIIGIHREGNLGIIWRRLRFNRFRMQHLGWGIATIVAAILAAQLITPALTFCIDKGLITLPESLPPYLIPGADPSAEDIQQMLGPNFSGNTVLAVALLLLLTLNVVAEECWWRGYILPRQEQAFGKKAWLLHGLLWTAFHSAQYWTLPVLLPVCLLISYVAYRTRSIWPGLLSHFVINGLGLIPLFYVIY